MIALVVGLGLFVAGCATQPGVGGDGRFSKDGIPHERYLVGGGLNVSYTAPCDGTAYLVDASSKKYVSTESLKAGKDFEFSPDYSDATIELLEKSGYKPPPLICAYTLSLRPGHPGR